ncbi:MULTISPECIES: ubiquinone biosynthesis regulatory protein kinase UbiB [unclassified Pseudomonas]|uniref:ubiquinone biosynthesis regulatory protein kinase UbiB n=1 Tax=unclassified Pseudomonas TaxID=196821 RepID=UPI0011A6BA50|nr:MULTISPECIES: ubiquinone biosynthesis regulatory protein kinase UbiB [unclassified Pseudomonas]
MKLLAVRRLFRIQRVVIRYRLDDLLFDQPLPWWLRSVRLLLPWRWLPRKASPLTRGARLRMALQELGPIFIKFGQLLSTRRDLLPNDIADELMLLQDRVPPFDPKQAVALIEAQLGAPVAQLFSRFDVEPLASASVAQVHAARLKTGEEVVVKVVRPGLKPIIAQDMAWLFQIAKVAERASADARRLHPVEIVNDYEKTIYDELDLLREAANASQLRRNFEGSELMYVPQVYWDLCRPKVLVMERIYGVPVTDMATLADQRTDMKLLAERGVEVFFTQVFRDSFFHADMHPGNIFVSTVKPWSPQYIAIDCGIVGSLTAEDQDYLARNLIAFFKRDYRRVAELHIDSGWVPAQTKVNEFEAAIRTVCEPIFEKPLKDISFGQVLMRLFQTARRFNMEVQPQLVLLQKTLLNIEGLGRQLYPDLDLWTTAKPYLERWMRERMSPKAVLGNIHSQVEQLPHLADMTRDLLERLSQPHLEDPKMPDRRHRGDRWALRLLGAGLLGGGAVLATGAAEAASLAAPAAWPAWLMLAAGLYLIVRQ